MENASKALLIAGAVLIVILIISVGMMIFSSSKGLFGSATTSMTEQEQKMFNSKFTMYEGTNVSGTQVMELIRAVMTNNSNDDNPKVTVGGVEPTDATVMPSNPQIKIKTTDRFTVTCSMGKTGLVDSISVVQKTTK